MALDISGIGLKLERASQNLRTINEEALVFLKQKFDPLATFEPDGTNEWAVYRWPDDTRVPNPMWGVYLGEFAHNVRSALDQLIWLMVLDNKQIPSKNTQFPIFERPREWRTEVSERKVERGAPCTEGISTEAFEVIDKCQPYHDDPAKRSGHQLAQLENISNIDKHQTLHVTDIGTVDGVSLYYVPSGYIELRKFRQGPGAYRFKAGAEICRAEEIWLKRPPLDSQVQVGFNGKAHVIFGQSEGDSVITLLRLTEILTFALGIVRDCVNIQAAVHSVPLTEGET